MIYYVHPGDTLTLIANKYKTTVDEIIKLNHINDPDSIFVGQQLIIKDPNNPYTLEVNRKKRILKLLKNGKVLKHYPVAVGKFSTPTPVGSWAIIKKSLWGGPFGGYFMRFSVPWGIYGIHGTNKPWSIGNAVSNGCVRMYVNDAKNLYSIIELGTPLLIY